MLSDFYQQNVVSLPLSDQAETGSGVEQPVRNNLTEGNGERGDILSSIHLFPFFSLMPKKTHCVN